MEDSLQNIIYNMDCDSLGVKCRLAGDEGSTLSSNSCCECYLLLRANARQILAEDGDDCLQGLLLKVQISFFFVCVNVWRSAELGSLPVARIGNGPGYPGTANTLTYPQIAVS